MALRARTCSVAPGASSASSAGLGGSADSLFHFKAGFSDQRHAFHTWRVVVDPAEYAALTRTRNPEASGNGFDGHFPAYRA